MRSLSFLSIIIISILSSSLAFVPAKSLLRPATNLEAAAKSNLQEKFIAASAAVVSASIPLLAFAEEFDDSGYEYGAVNAPGGLTIAWVGGILAIATAAVPVLMQSGEEAFNEMREESKDTFGKRNDLLKRRR